jgi:hypothetical protein
MAGKIFINYRRDDAIGTAGRLHDRLTHTFGRNNLFMDVDHIPAGVDFVEHLHSQVAACDVFLAVIGPNWLNAKDERGRRRFDNPDDYVTIEIAAALARNIRVIPVLVDGARTPKGDRLPDSIKPLVRRNAVEVRNTNFGRDAEALANKVHEALKSAQPATGRWPFLASGAAWLMVPGRWRTVAGTAMALLLVGWIGLYQVGAPVWVPWAPDTPDKAKAVADAEAQRKAIEAEQQRIKDEVERQAKAAADAEAKRRAAEAEQQRLKDEEQRQAKAAADAEAKRKAAEAEQQRLAAIKEEEQRQTKAADLEAKLKAAEAEQQRLKEEVQRQAKAAADAEAKRRAAEAEQQRLKEEAERQTRAAADAEAKRRAAEAEQQRLAAVKAEEERKAKSASTDSFERRSNMMATGYASSPAWDNGGSIGECERKCSQSAACKVVTYNKINATCNFYTSADFVPNDDFDSGIRASASEQQRLAAVKAEEERKTKAEAEAAATKQEALPQATSTVTAASFESRPNSVGIDKTSGSDPSGTVETCQKRCTQRSTCQAFTFSKSLSICFLYDLVPSFRSDPNFDSGVLSRK